MTIILVTGATGFIGMNLVKKLSDRGDKIICVSKKGGRIGDILVDAVDCADQEAINCYCNDRIFDAVFHLAAFIPSPSSDLPDKAGKQSVVENVTMAMNLLEICEKRKGIKFIYASSTSVYGYQKKLPITEEAALQPRGFYPLGKFIGELICRQYQEAYDPPATILRICSPYGPAMSRETVIKSFIRKALSSRDITLYGTGNRSQDFVYIEDVTDAIVQAYDARATGVYNVCSGTATSMTELAETILRVLPSAKSRIVYTDTVDPQENYRAVFSIEKARRSFSYNPRYSLEDGIRQLAEATREELGL